MKLPATDLMLEGGLRCAAYEVDAKTWQAHVLKHPLGVHRRVALDGKPLPWNCEGWETLVPPVITAGRRDHLIARIASLGIGGLACEVPEVRRRRVASSQTEIECYDCGPPLVAACASACRDDAVSGSYAETIVRLLTGMQEGAAVVVERARLTRTLLRMFRAGLDAFRELTVLTVGVADRGSQPIARLSRGDGVRVEFYRSGTVLRQWRTAHRTPPVHVNASIGFLLDMARQGSGGPLSDLCVVARPWWENHGT